MAEFEVNVGDLTINIEDSDLADAVDYRVTEAAEQAVTDQLDNMDWSDTMNDIIWSFGQWDEVIANNLGHCNLLEKEEIEERIRDAAEDVELDKRIEDLLRDFLRVTLDNRCGMGEAFADAVTMVVKEVVPDILEELDAELKERRAAAFNEDFYQTVERISRSNIKLAQQSGLDELDRIWATGSQAQAMREFTRGIEGAVNND
tara:strand:- start:5525 stop:6133 length:609 start_codon:yes stop_codon:yes gene_type:complete